jgi:N-acetylglutamate synthase-like GNAT family acetyltransferase
VPAIAEAPKHQYPEIAEFYRIQGSRGRPSPADRIFIAEEDGVLVGAVRLCEEEGVTVLRTMRVAASRQRQGIGRRLLATLAQALESRECFLLGFGHLEGFYGLEGFARIDPRDLPPHLRERLRLYLADRPDVIPMRRVARASPAT